MALYNKYRPKSLDEACGQDFIKQILKGRIRTNDLPNAFLFIGPAGVGKTTIARIFAGMVNCSTGPCENPPTDDKFVSVILTGKNSQDVTELDAASHGGVEDMRDLRQKANYAPMAMRRKIYIIDECHALSDKAWQALLKVIEEPPEWVMFILCTTDESKIPTTIMSRVIELRFNPLPVKTIADRLKFICQSEGIKATDDAIRLLAFTAGGSMRVGITNLEKLVHLDAVTAEAVSEQVGVADRSHVRDFFGAIINRKFLNGLAASSQCIGRGVRPDKFLSAAANYCHDILVCGVDGYDMEALGYTPSDIEDLRKIRGALDAKLQDFRRLVPRWVEILQKHHEMTVFNIQPQFQVDMTFVELFNAYRLAPPKAAPAPTA